MRSSTVLVLCIALLHAAPLTAQHASEPTSGSRIRITAPPVFGQPRIGTSKELARDTLFYLDRNLAEQAVPLLRVDRLEVSEGVRSNTANGAVLGFLVGAGLGGGAMYMLCTGTDDCPVGIMTVAAAGVGGLVGAVVGALIGSTQPERGRVLPPTQPW